MTRTLDDARRWMQQGAALISNALGGLDDRDFAAEIELPGWTRGHLVAHLCANADAIGNLVHWAATGEPTPMYASQAQRNADIEAGGQKSGSELTRLFNRSAAQLDEVMGNLAAAQWNAAVVNAQGRTVRASETPWMRSREVMVHGVDLDAGIGFSDLPADFLAALCSDIADKRSEAAGSESAGPALVLAATDTGDSWIVIGTGSAVRVTGPVADLAAYLAGRGNAVVEAEGSSAPALAAWL